MRFGTRLVLFLVITLVVVQVTTIGIAGSLMRQLLLTEGESQVAAAEVRFIQQLSELEEQLASGVRLLTLDFALRQAIADQDAATVVSALRNHGRRVGASRMLLIDPDGRITGSTQPDGALVAFRYPALLDRAIIDDRAANVVIMDGKPVWLVVVPVMAPDLIAFIGAAIPLDEDRLDHMRQIAGVPGQIGIVTKVGSGWVSRARAIDSAILQDLPGDGTPVTRTKANGDEAIVATRTLQAPLDGEPVRVVIDYPLSDVLRRYERISLVLLPILTVGLCAMLFGAGLIARGVSRPIEALARQTKRIAEGDYTPPPVLVRGDELGQLSTALHAMTMAIAEREESIRFQATHDALTGLPNRRAISSVVSRWFGSSGAVLMIRLIRWPDIIATVGREMGDRLLCDAAERIKSRIETITGAAVGRIGENTFAVTLAHAGEAQAISTAARLTAAFDQPYCENEFTIDTPVAVGIALTPRHGSESTILLRRAEIALTAAMATDVHHAIYSAQTDPHRPDRLSLMSELRTGLSSGAFELVYQPKLDLRQNRITGAEALVRWHHPTRGPIYPDEFIGLAEETGNIQHLTRWALRAGLSEAARWRDQGLPARVAINVSPRDLTDQGLPDRIDVMLREFRLEPRSLIIEITESAIMGEPEAAIAVLRRLDERGIDLAIDDFGVGQSSLAYLRRLPVREIKLDKTFVMKLSERPDYQAIVGSVIKLSHDLGYRVTAEGVENEQSLHLLRNYGCDLAQGYYIGRPMSATALVNMLVSEDGPAPSLTCGPPL